MKCGVAAGRGSRCCKAAIRPSCPSWRVLALTPCPSLPSARISCCCYSCHGNGHREEVGGDVFGRGSAALLLVTLCIGSGSRPRRRLFLLLRHGWVLDVGRDAFASCGRVRRWQGLCGKSRGVVEEFLRAGARWSAAGSKAN